ncbi:NADH:flavin oxidoreductase/NADH oxidase family protein [Rhodococcus sp. D2-41]|uniref:NADH:flavin oxidoreductase/NADH oxidase family protein n=1 Tax=Speluncibacter jeojiensis TaxID=2710754 RepID=A0A9X4LY09_9ACTN|nr:NADH:flavin oxidoreductase/NADH oxidase family protein [Rhodococcus sp. D2-41]MDG3011883.1 NADH:flavin oxidoreductase/NADH oxidase family protein [Rhodococcus sp. D2-41]MDG3013334.1 NADH:flavin oxidoreductase/NADH oxidase family protein [Corynebacteriales bacterium D3-21]
MPDATTLATPLPLPCGVTLPNRMAKAALSEGLGDKHNGPTARLDRLYRRWSGSGAGLLITGNVMIDRTAIGEPGNVVVEDTRHLAELRRWAESATAGGSRAWVQINHPGRQIPRHLSARPVAPSEIAIAGTGGAFARPRALNHQEILDLVQRFATAARTVVDAGFGGVQVHAAHGYLISQFLSPLTNQRDDEWGGSAQNRRRFLLEVVRATRAAVGPRVPVSVKLNSADFQRGGMTEDESVEVVLELADLGIDLLEISGGTYESTAMMGMPAEPAKDSTRAREAYFLDYAERVRSVTDARTLPLMLTGGFRTGGGMTDALESGAVDMIGLGRPLILEPDLPARLLAGTAQASTVRPRRIGIAKLDGASDLVWHSTQMWRLADGKEPLPNRHPALTIAHYLTETGLASLRRPRRGFAA